MTDLLKLEQDILKKINSGSSGTDVSYWEDIYGLLIFDFILQILSDQLTVHIAKVRMRDLHQKMLKQKLQRIRDEQLKQMADSDASGINSTKVCSFHYYVYVFKDIHFKTIREKGRG